MRERALARAHHRARGGPPAGQARPGPDHREVHQVRGRGAMSILVVGSVAYDTVETPFGRAEKVLGGSASFFSVAASFFAPVNLVAVVGDDFSEKAMSAFRDRPVDLEGLERTAGKTFHWQGRYSYDLNSRETVCTDLNVFEFFKPRIPDRYRRSEHVVLRNIHTVLERRGLEQVERPQLSRPHHTQ